MTADLSQGQACDLTYLKEVMSWSNCETRKDNGETKGKIDPMRWEFFLLKIGMHPGWILVPRCDVDMPKRRIRRNRAKPNPDVFFAIEYLSACALNGPSDEYWLKVPGHPFTTLTAACSALDLFKACQVACPVRIARYIQGKFDCVIDHTDSDDPAEEGEFA